MGQPTLATPHREQPLVPREAATLSPISWLLLQALDKLCVDLDRVYLETRDLQALSTTQLPASASSDPDLDIL